MLETMTYVGLDVHARSTHAAAIDVVSGELRRARFAGGSEQVIEWLQTLPQPLKGCYEAGPTGFALYRAAKAVGLRIEVIAPSKTPRPAGDRVKSDRKDAELLARLLLAGQLKAVTVPPPPFEAARHLARAREQVRGDLMRSRHRVSKLLLLHGRVYDGSAWTKTHRRWLAQLEAVLFAAGVETTAIGVYAGSSAAARAGTALVAAAAVLVAVTTVVVWHRRSRTAPAAA